MTNLDCEWRCALGAALLAALSLAAAPAQAADPIKVGMSLALTGAGAPAGKMLQAAIELWRDDINAKGGLLGRPVEIIIYDDQSNPSGVPGLYTKLISVDKADLLVGPYGTNFVAPAMPTIIQNKKMLISYTAIGINDQYNYDKYFSMVPVGSGRRERLLQGLLRDGGEAESQAADGRDHRRRRRVRPGRRPGRPRGAEEARLQADLRQELSAEHHRLHAGDARGAGRQCRHRLCRRLSARQRRPGARRQRDRTNPKDIRRRADRPAGHADQGAARPDAERPRHPRELRAVAEAQLPGPRRPDEALSGQGGAN